jgi:hypothetical protein
VNDNLLKHMAPWLFDQHKKAMENKYQPGSQESSGSSENRGGSRSDQQHQKTSTSKSERKEVARDIGVGRKHISDINELGGRSGRDDYSGSTEGMSEQDTGSPTDR